MAGNSVIGALRVVLGADTAALEKGLKDARGSLGAFSATAGKTMAALGASMAVALGGVAAGVRNVLAEADKLGKMAQSIGIPVAELSKLKYAAELSDISLESLGTAMGRLAKNMSEVAGGATGAASEAFKSLGISVRDSDGAMKSSTAILSEIAGKFEGFRDGANKTALAMALFGKSGADLIPMLNAGKTGLADMMAEAEKLGLVIDTKTAKAAENFNDNLTKMGKIGEGVMIHVTAALAEDLDRLSTEFVAAARDADLLNSASTTLSAGLRSLGTVTIASTAWFKDWALTITATREAASQAWAGNFSGAWDALKKYQAEAKKVFEDAEASIGRVWSPQAKVPAPDMSEAIAAFLALGREVTKLGEDYLKLEAPALRASGAMKNSLQTFLDGVAQRNAAMTADAAAVGLSADAHGRLTTALQAYAIAAQNNIAITPELKAKIDELSIGAGNAALKLEAANIAAASQTPGEAVAAKFDTINRAFASGAMNAEIHSKAMTAMYLDASESISGSFSEIARTFGKEGSAMVRAAQIFGAAQALISTMVGQAEALKLPFPMNLAAAAAIAAKGFGLVAAIKGSKVPGYAMGGAFTVPGGVGGGDRVPVSFMAEPGERVEISSNRPDGYQSGGRAGAGGMVEIHLHGKSFDRDQVRGLMEQIGDMMADGYKLKIAT